MKNNVVYLFVAMLFLLAGCEYGLGDHFVDVKKPSADGLQMNMYLNIPDYDNQLYIRKSYLVGYDVEIPGQTILSCTFKLGEKEWTSEGKSGQFYIDTDVFPNGIYELSCEVYAKTGSGSIADQAGVEAYIAKQTWPLRVIARDPTNNPLANRVNEDGYLEVSWNVEEELRSAFDHYEVVFSHSNGGSITQVLKNFDQRSYVDETYIGKEGISEVYIYFKDETARPYSLGKAVLNQIDPQVKVEHPTPDRVCISWHNPYRSVVNVIYQGQVVAEKVTDETAEFPFICFSDAGQRVELEFGSIEGVYTSTSFQYSVSSQLFELGVCVAPSVNWPRYGYNLQEDVLYVSSYNEVTSWQLPDFRQSVTFNSTQQPNVDSYALSLFDNRMAASHSWGIELFEGKEMRRVQLLSVEHPVSFGGSPTLTKDGKLITFLYKPDVVKGIVYDVVTTKKEAEFALPEGVFSAMDAHVTPDARYLYYSINNELYAANLTGYQCSDLRKLSSAFASWCIDPLHSERLFVSDEKKVTLYDCSSSFSMLKTFNLPGMRVCNVDPKTGYLLLKDQTHLIVLDPQTEQTLLTLPMATSQLSLWGNTLCAGNGYAFNIEKYLKK